MKDLSAEDWKKMYMILLGGIDEALKVLPYFPDNIKAHESLWAASREAEEYYIDACGGES